MWNEQDKRQHCNHTPRHGHSGKKEYAVMQLQAGEELAQRSQHIAVGGLFLIFGELITLAFFLCGFGQKAGEEGVLLV